MDEQNVNTNIQGNVGQGQQPVQQNVPQANAQVQPAKPVQQPAPDINIDEFLKSIQPLQPTPDANKEAGVKEEKSYKAKPTDLPIMPKEEGKEEIVENDEIVLPSAPSPLPEKAIAGGNVAPIKDSLEDIVPNVGIPKAVTGKVKEHNLASPEGVLGKNNNKEDLVPQKEDLGKPMEKKEKVQVQSNLNGMEQLLQKAIDRKASDLHITVGYPVTVRIDGELEALDEKVISPQESESLIYSILSDEKKELLEVNKEIDFAHSFKDGNKARFRVNAYYSKGNLSAAFRLIPSHIRTIEELMLPQIYHQFAQLKQGLILVTGPTGHGKSTTIAAILEDINRTRFSHIVTIEDPIEYVFQGQKSLIDQREMNSDTHSWTVALKSALRQDPDVILVGEMRDYETIASAITLAETGHLVFATLHTNSAAQTIDRIIDVFPENQQAQVKIQLANILEAVVAQRLIPLDTGGRRAVSEIMLGVPSIKNLIREGKTHQIDNVIRTSSDVGMVSLESSLVKLVREGVITLEKAQEYAVFPEEIVRFMKK
jgi:twitching motility protein PilT